jgi:hypothetical protein
MEELMSRVADFENDRPSETYLKELANNNVEKVVVPKELVEETKKDAERLNLHIDIAGHREHDKAKTIEEHQVEAQKAHDYGTRKRQEVQYEEYCRQNHKRRYF